MITLAIIAGIVTLAMVFCVPFVKGLERMTWQKHPAHTFTSASPVKLMAIVAPKQHPPTPEAKSVKTIPLNSILIPPAAPDVQIGLDVFCTPGNGEGDGSVAVDIGYWIEV